MNNYRESICRKYMFVYGEKAGYAKYRKTALLKIILTAFALLFSLLAFFTGNDVTASFISGLIFAAFSLFLPDYLIYTKAKKYSDAVASGLADTMDQLAMLVNAGMPLWNALDAACRQQDRDNVFALLLNEALSDCSSEGCASSPEDALGRLSDRCRNVSVSSFVATVIQNSRKGSEELSALLRISAAAYRNEKKYVAKRKSEEAATLMLIPAVLVFAAVIGLVAAPAVVMIISGFN